MATPSRRSVPGSSELRRRHRIRILSTLLGVCRSLERLELSADARGACRQVAGLLAAALERENPGCRR